MSKSTRHSKAPKPPRPNLNFASLEQEIEDLGSELFTSAEGSTALHAIAQRLVDRYGVAVSGIWVVNPATAGLELGPVAGKPGFPASLAKVATGRPSLLVAALGHDEEIFTDPCVARANLDGLLYVTGDLKVPDAPATAASAGK